jgi:hypothetical protein
VLKPKKGGCRCLYLAWMLLLVMAMVAEGLKLEYVVGPKLCKI